MLVALTGSLGAYLLGSIPFAWLIGRLFYGLDIREHGSGNVGATNVYRVIGWQPGMVCLLLDAFKGALPVLAAEYFQQRHEVVVCWALAAILGHSRSIFLKFGGGKSVATAAGAIFAMSKWVGLCTVGTWGLLFALTRIVSVGSLAGAISLPIWMVVWSQPKSYLAFSVLAALFVIFRHRSNLSRLLAGQEGRFGGRHGG